MMRSTTATVLLLLLAALAGCGGSGSSGFDVTPLSENALIDDVLDSGQCADSGATRLCPAGGEVMGTPGPGHPNGAPGVSLDLPLDDEVPCTISADSTSCVFVLSFSSTGFDVGAVYRTAVREVADGAAWQVGEIAPSAGAATFAVPLAVPPDGESIQIAVLVFTGGAVGAPGPTQTLAETGATAAFVTDTITVASLR